MCYVHGLIKGFWHNNHDLMIGKLGVRGVCFLGCSSGSILGPLFNIFINDLFLFVLNSYLSNYADESTLYAFGYNQEEIKNKLHFDFDFKMVWRNYIVQNADKCHFIWLGKDTENETFIFNNFIFNNSNVEKILGITIDNKLNFKNHIKILCRKTTQKIGALSRLLNHLSDSQKRLIFNSIIKSQFNYCPLKWMFCSRTSIIWSTKRPYKWLWCTVAKQ